MRALYAEPTRAVRPRACDAGVPIYAGTDAGGYLPHGLVGKEIAALAGFSSPEYALGAGSWRARTWLGRARPAGRGRAGRPGDLRPPTRGVDLAVLTGPRHVITGSTHVYVDV